MIRESKTIDLDLEHTLKILRGLSNIRLRDDISLIISTKEIGHRGNHAKSRAIDVLEQNMEQLGIMEGRYTRNNYPGTGITTDVITLSGERGMIFINYTLIAPKPYGAIRSKKAEKTVLEDLEAQI